MSTPHCSAKELKILGDFWTLEIIQSLLNSPKRFSELERDLPNVNPTTLTNRLRKLELQKLITKKKDTPSRQSITYSLTPKGKAISPILKEIKRFADNFVSSK